MASSSTNEIQQKLKSLFILQQAIRDFFLRLGFDDVITPPMVRCPGIETHLFPFKVQGSLENQNDWFLHTSPEFHMKELLSLGMEKIFTLTYAFRDEPTSTHHRLQFLMLEWYRAHERYEAIMQDVEQLLNYAQEALIRKSISTVKSDSIKLTHKSVQEIFIEFTQIDPLEFEENSKDLFVKKIKEKNIDIPIPQDLSVVSYDDIFHLVFLNIIEPHLAKYPYLLLYEYPASQAALSSLKVNNPKVCERFEVYLNGIELCNAFNELTDKNEQLARFIKAKKEREDIYGQSMPFPAVLMNSLERGLPDPCSGVALGVERLLMGLTGIRDPFWPNI